MREWKIYFYDLGGNVRFDMHKLNPDGTDMVYQDNDCNINFVPRKGEQIELLQYKDFKTYEVINVTYDLYRQDVRVDIKQIYPKTKLI